MPTKIMDQRHRHIPAASLFSEELRFPSEKHIGIWQTDFMADSQGTEGMPLLSGSRTVSSLPFEKPRPIGGNTSGSTEIPHAYFFRDNNTKIDLGHSLIGMESTTGAHMTSWKTPNPSNGSHSSFLAQPISQLVEGNKVKSNGVHHENGLFSSSLSEIFNKKLSLISNGIPSGRSMDTTTSNFGDNDTFESLEEIEAHTIGNLLPDDEDLLSGIIDHHDYVSRPNSGDDTEDDLFCSVGGMELEVGNNLNPNTGYDFVGCPTSYHPLGAIGGQFAGEHLYGGHPSRTIFARNIDSNVQDVELRDLFEQYGDIRALYTACKHRGFIMISYYDIRAALDAMRALQNKPLRHRRLDLQFSVSKDNPSEKDNNQCTLKVLILDFSVSNDDLCQIFGAYGEIKKIHDIPHKHHKLIEFYDVRASEAALHALNKSDIAGKRIKLEHSHHGRWSSLNQLSPALDQRVSPPLSSPTECLVSSGSILGAESLNVLEHVPFRNLHSTTQPLTSPFMETSFHGISPSVPCSSSSTIGLATISSQNNHSGPNELSHSMGQMNFNYPCTPAYHPHSLPEFHGGMINGIPLNSPSTMSPIDIINSRSAGGIDTRHVQRVGTASLNNHSFEHHEGAFGMLGNGSCPLHGHQYAMNNLDSYHHTGPMMWQNSLAFANNISHPPPRMHGFQRAPSHAPNTVPSLHNHHVGSAPTLNPSLWDMRHAYAGDTLEAAAYHPGSLGIGFAGSPPMHPLELASHNIFPQAGRNCIDPSMSSAHVGVPPQQRGHIFHGKNMISSSYDASNDRVRSRRSDTSANQADNKKQYELDIDRIMHGEDSRTTLMIKNIPNKYTSKMLLATIDEHHRGSYDFIYLPIDFKNKCNVGYAFINMIDPQNIIPFYKAFNGKKWEKFNSEKVASLAYARIQGRQALIAHFQNSSLMNEDKRCRPILFHTDGPNLGDQEPFPMGTNIRSRPGRPRTAANEEMHHGSPPTSASGEDSSSSGSTKGSE